MIAIVAFGATIFLLFCFDSLSPLAFQQLGVSKALFGVAVAGIGFGGVLGTIVVGRYGGDVNPFVLMGAGTAIVGCDGGAHRNRARRRPRRAAVDLDAGADRRRDRLGGRSSSRRRRSSSSETPRRAHGPRQHVAGSIPTACRCSRRLAGAALAEWQSVGFVFPLAGGLLAVVGVGVLVVRPAVGVGVPVAAVAADAVSMAGTGVPSEPTEVRR